jgi:phosphoribosylglycinamide formyltransferase-1
MESACAEADSGAIPPTLQLGRECDVTTSAPEVDALERLSEICLALPEAEREQRTRHARFSVRGKKFAYFLDDHHGDGILSVCCRAAPGENAALVASDPERFYLPAYIAHRGWVALRLDREPLDWSEVAELVVDSYRLVAPKRLASLVAGVPG